MPDLRIDNGLVVTMDQRRRVIQGGSVAVEDGKIVAVGETSTVKRQYPRPDHVLDATHMLVLPGLVNAHTHANSTLLRGLSDEGNLADLVKVFFPFADALTADDAYVGSLLACIEFIRSGSTCFADINNLEGDTARAVQEAGLRAVLAEGLADTNLHYAERKPKLQDATGQLRSARKFVQRWNGKAGGRIKAWLGPFTDWLASKELLREAIALADDLKTGLHIHMAETYQIYETVRRIYGKRNMEYANDLGLLRRGSILAHSCWLSDHEVSLIAKTGAAVAHCPSAEMKLADGVTPVPALLQAGATVGLGTDSPSCNNSNDLVRDLKQVTLLHKITKLDAEVVPAEAALEMGTIHGARAVMLEREIGSLEKGKKADIILVSLAKAHYTPVLSKPKPNAVANFVYAGSGEDVDTTIVDGRILMQHRKLTTLDEDQIIARATRAAEKVQERSGLVKWKSPWRWST